MNTPTTKIFLSRDRMWGDTFAVRIGRKFGDSERWAVAQKVEFRVLDSNAVETEPCISLSRDDAQAFMDELWSAGLRPTEGAGSAGSLAATERHLQDMRTLVFKLEAKK